MVGDHEQVNLEKKMFNLGLTIPESQSLYSSYCGAGQQEGRRGAGEGTGSLRG